MSNIAIQSQTNSSLYNSALQGSNLPLGRISQFVYDMEGPQVNAFRSRDSKTQILGCQPGGTYQCSIPSFGLWRDSYIKFNVSWKNGTNNLSPTIADALGANIISSARILSNSRTIYELTSAQIQYLIYTDTNIARREGRKKAMYNKHQDRYRGSAPNAPGGETVPLKLEQLKATADSDLNYLATNSEVQQTHDVYCPLPFSMFDSDKSNIDTSFTESLILEIKMNEAHLCVSGGLASTNANNALVTPFTINKAELCNEYLIINSDAKKKIQEMNFSLGGSPLALLGSDFKTKSIQVTGDAGTTKATLNLFFTELCAGILFEIQPVRTAEGLSTITDKFTGLAVDDTNAGTLSTTVSARVFQPADRAGLAGVTASKGQCKKGRFIHCNKISIRAGGKLIYEGTHHEIRNLNGSAPMCHNVNGDLETAHEEDTVFASCYNLYYINFANSHKTTEIAGALALRNLNSIVVELEFPSVSTVKYDVTAHMRHYVARSISGDSGAISQALSN